PVDATTRPLRANRAVVLGIGLAAGGAGLAGALADPQLAWVALGGAVVVGGFAAHGGQTWLARRLGWVGAVLAAEAFALVTAYLLGASRPEAAFAPLAVAAAALLVVPRLPQLRGPGRQPVTRAELAVVEWLGGYASVALALGLTLGSPPHLAAVLIGGGAVLGLAGLNPDLTHTWRRGLWWSAALSEVAAWWIIMRLNEVAVLEAYTLPFAAFALLVGALEARYRPELGSWVTWGPGLVAALGPSLVAVVTTTAPDPARQARGVGGSRGCCAAAGRPGRPAAGADAARAAAAGARRQPGKAGTGSGPPARRLAPDALTGPGFDRTRATDR